MNSNSVVTVVFHWVENNGDLEFFVGRFPIGSLSRNYDGTFSFFNENIINLKDDCVEGSWSYPDLEKGKKTVEEFFLNYFNS